MQEILFHYQKIHPMNWVYLSSILMIGLYFKFSRFWSVRNADLLGLALLAPGLILVEYGRNPPTPAAALPDIELAGFIWLFVVGGIFLVRALMDSMMVRRPLLEPNLSVGGMLWVGICLSIFLLANVANSEPVFTPDTPSVADHPSEDSSGEITAGEDSAEKTGLQKYGPRFAMLSRLPRIETQIFFGTEASTQRQPLSDSEQLLVSVTKTLAIICHLAVVIGLIVVGYLHFDNIRTGVAATVLYLMLPYTAEMTGDINHCLPAALLVWAIALYRRPLAAGLVFGLALAAIYFPLFLLPLWISFYWQRGMLRFCIGVAVALAISVAALAFFSDGVDQFVLDLRQMLGLSMPRFDNLSGIWKFIPPWFRLPIIATFIALGGSFALWPAQKNLGTLLSGTTAMMIGAQFWHGQDGGLCMAWYLPPLLLTIFRPNLEDRVATTAVGVGWLSRRRTVKTESSAV